MSIKRSCVPMTVLTIVLCCSSMAAAQEFKPFTPVKNVCPTCPQKGYDRIELKDGQVIEAVVFAENPAYYVLGKHGELRAEARDKVSKIDRSADAVRQEGHEDQILLKNGVVFSGKIVNEHEKNGMFEIRIPTLRPTVYAYKSQIVNVYKAGKLHYPAKP